MSTIPNQTATVPAQLGFLTIYNPSLGTTDETIDDQIVYYASVNTQTQRRKHRSRGKPTANVSQEERNERLRQIGLAQGMVEFSRGFSDGKPVDTIETEKTRVVLQELEPGWWILASIDLSKIPLPPRIGPPTSDQTGEQSENVEYSSRELKPSTLLLRDLLRAHSIFLLHHAPSLSALFVKSKRSNFVKLLSRFWDLFLSTWDVMLHGNPAANVFRGIKLAACGELGVGVGEEDRGSGEREVLEGFVGRIDGLTDLVVSKFGSSQPLLEAESAKDGTSKDDISDQWLGTGEEPGAEDGAVFLGVGALSRKSLRDITCWMEDIYTWGENAYGVKERPTSTRQARRGAKSADDAKEGSKGGAGAHPSDRTSTPASQRSSTGDGASDEQAKAQQAEATSHAGEATDEGGMTKLMGYLKMGYGTHWTLGSSDDTGQTVTSAMQGANADKAEGITAQRFPDTHGHYLIGLLGDMEEPDTSEGRDREQETDDLETSDHDSRVLLRTLTVELDDGDRAEAQHVEDLGSQCTELTLTPSGDKDYMDPNSQFDSQDRNKSQKLRVVVYVNKPFIFTFLFRNRTDSLALEGLYRSLHHQLAPLRKPLALSTTYRPNKPDVGEAASRIFDLVWDPKAMTVHSTLPSIPTPMEMLRQAKPPVWSRAEAVNTHNQILNMYAATLTDYSELERTCKTNRGWWIVWTRILEHDPLRPQDTETETATDIAEDKASGISDPSSANTQQEGSQKDEEARRSQDHLTPLPKPKVSKEIILIRRAGQHHTGLGGTSGSYSESSGGGIWSEGTSRLAQGIGIDTTKYIDALLGIGR
ncbi:hypothetical protein GGS20DRAFT_565618 [Poronia punctata]|nr:hypothetical protein GGS20DRAFT_565618 [Poronia punctata]